MVHTLQDAKAAKAWGVPLIEWLPWIISCEAKSEFAWDDPMPLLIGKFWWRLSHLVNRSFREAPPRYRIP
jgi:hypothetical protein